MIKNVFWVFLLIFVQTSDAQNLSPTVLNSSGGVIQNSAISLEWSLGELAVSTIGTPSNLLTQGFLQPNLNIVGTEDLFDESRFAVFPNPVSGFLALRTDIQDIKTIQVHDVFGRLAVQSHFQPVLDLNNLDSGVFIVTLFNGRNQFLHSFKICKI